MTPVRSIHPGLVAVIRSALYDLHHGLPATIDYGIRGTTRERPWAVVAVPKRGEGDG